MVLKIVLILVSSYLIGSIPIGWIIVKIFKGDDVRKHGSGRVGGTNVMRQPACWLVCSPPLRTRAREYWLA
jgi:glycerol-3-phosphate acyltransferase PlsY